MYKVEQTSSGKTFTKTRVLYKHPVPHAESALEKVSRHLSAGYRVLLKDLDVLYHKSLEL